MDLHDIRFSFVPAKLKRCICNRLRFASNSYAMLRTSRTKGSKGKKQRRKQYSAVCTTCIVVHAVQGGTNQLKLFTELY